MTAPLPRPEEWAVDALCAETDPEAFFPDKGGSTQQAKRICNGTPVTGIGPGREPCPVRHECLRFALNNDERFGIWGGLSERERRQLRNPRPVGRPATGRAA